MSKKNRFGIVFNALLIILLVELALTGPVKKKTKKRTAIPQELEFILLHNNDMHARFDPTFRNSSMLKTNDSKPSKSYGGFARTAHVVKVYREEAAKGGLPVLYLNAGDTFEGTPWFTLHEHKVSSEFMNFIKPDAMSLGNHEFDLDVEGLIPFLDNVDFPVLAANIRNSEDHPLWQTKSLRKSTVLQVKGIKIGVIGYVTPETKTLTAKSDVEFGQEISAINKEAKAMKRKGINIIIALGHSGYKVDMEIAKNCDLVDIVVGGHSHTFLYSGKEPDVEKSEGPYPTIITQSSGKEVPVVQAYAFTKYMGVMKLKFDANGNLVHWEGKPLLLDGDIERDPKVMALQDSYRVKVNAILQKVIGRTRVQLDSRKCRLTECNIGNLISDAFFNERVKQYDGPHLTDAPIALVAAGDIRASASTGKITRFELDTILPYPNELMIVNATGKIVKEALEHSVRKFAKGAFRGEFLQVSGLRVDFNTYKPPGQRVASVKVLCATCDVPDYQPLDERKEYGVILSSFLKQGGDGFSMFKNLRAIGMGITTYNATRKYIEDSNVVFPIIEGRLHVNTGEKHTKSIKNKKKSKLRKA